MQTCQLSLFESDTHFLGGDITLKHAIATLMLVSSTWAVDRVMNSILHAVCFGWLGNYND